MLGFLACWPGTALSFAPRGLVNGRPLQPSPFPVHARAGPGVPTSMVSFPSVTPLLTMATAISPRAGATIVVAITAIIVWLFRSLTTPARQYSADGDYNSVQKEYNAWTNDGILEHYWGEHIHLGYYSDAERAAGYKKKDFIQAKYDFIDEMLKWSGAPDSATSILDVGCGIGGTTRYLAKKFPGARVTGISISDAQIARATELARAQKVPNAEFLLRDALAMDFPDNSFDVVWAIESGEHMPDKKKYVEEMARVLKPGGTLVFATWCQRETPPEFTPAERDTLDFLYGEWTHPYFISIEEYSRLMEGTGVLEEVSNDDWAKVRLARPSSPAPALTHVRALAVGDHPELAPLHLGRRVGPLDCGSQAPRMVEDRARWGHPGAHAQSLLLGPHALRHAQGQEEGRGGRQLGCCVRRDLEAMDGRDPPGVFTEARCYQPRTACKRDDKLVFRRSRGLSTETDARPGPRGGAVLAICQT